MKLKLLWDDTRGAVIVEFSVTVAFFLALTFGLVQGGLLLFTQLGLQHGVEVAARCASVNYSANQIVNPPLAKSCFIVDGAAVAPSNVTTIDIEKYAAQNSWGFVPAFDKFVVTPPPTLCGTNRGYLIQATTPPFNVLRYFFSIQLSATSCFPVNVS